MTSLMKRFMKRSWGFIVLLLLILTTASYLISISPPTDSSALAAWVQGVGSLLAILFAGWMAREQFVWQQTAERQRQRQRAEEELSVVVEVLQELRQVFYKCSSVAGAGDLADFLDLVGPDGKLENDGLPALLEFLNSTSLSPGHGPALHKQLIASRRDARRAAGYIEQLQQRASGATAFNAVDRELVHQLYLSGHAMANFANLFAKAIIKDASAV